MGAREQQVYRGAVEVVTSAGNLERFDLHFHLAPDPQRGPGGGQHRQPGSRLDQGGDPRRHLQQVLDVVEHEKGALVTKSLDDCRGPVGARSGRCIHGVGDRGQHLVGRPERRQLDVGDTVGEAVPHRSCNGQRQSRLADAAHPRQRDQPLLPDQFRHPGYVLVAPQQGGGRRGQ